MLNAWNAVSADVDLRADDNHVVVQCDVPGVKREDLEITLENRALTVKGKRNFEKGGPNERVALGRNYGAFQHSFALPDDVDESQLVARLADGVLTLEVPGMLEPSLVKLRYWRMFRLAPP